MDVFSSFHATGLSVLINFNRNSIVSDLIGVSYGKALANNYLLFVIVKQIPSQFHF